MSYTLNVPTVKLYGETLKVVDYSSTSSGYTVTVRMDEYHYERAAKLKRLELRMPHDDRVFHATHLGDYEVAKRANGEPSDVIIEFTGRKFVPEKGEII